MLLNGLGTGCAIENLLFLRLTSVLGTRPQRGGGHDGTDRLGRLVDAGLNSKDRNRRVSGSEVERKRRKRVKGRRKRENI